MTHWISVSGGLGSAISCIVAHENKLDYEMVFADTLIEDDDLYRFIYEMSAKLGKKLHHLKDGRNPWQVFIYRRYIGNSRLAHCSDVLKTDMVRNFLETNATAGDILVLGMDLSELDRIERAEKKWSPRKVSSLLNEFKCWRPTWKELLKRYNIAEPRLYSFGFPHNNCGGMCVKAGLTQFATLLKYFPDRYKWHEEWQEYAMYMIGPTAKPFLRKVVAGETLYLTLRVFRNMVEAGVIDIDPYDFGGCGCFADE